MIRFDQFSWKFAYAPSHALREVSLHIPRAELAAIAGPSGSGKTTLALAMCGLLVGRHDGISSGKVYVGGQNVADTPLHEIAETIGLVQQNPETHFATLTVSDEIAFGMENRCLDREEIGARCTEAMELLCITHLKDRDLATLSGGEQQRVAVASIVAGKPEVIVLDEPTASLDPQAAHDLFRSLAGLCRGAGLTVVIIEHKLDHLLPLKPRLVYLNAGRVEADVPTGSVTESCLSALSDTRPLSTMPVMSVAAEHDRGAAAVTASTAGPDVKQQATSVSPTDGALVEVSYAAVALEGLPILEDISFSVHAGEVVAVMGPNGGGKSTLLYALMGLVRPVAGSIRVRGTVVSPKMVSRLARDVGFVFQNADHQLFADTVWGEAMFAARVVGTHGPAQEEQAARLLEQAGLTERWQDHPYRLSWGQKRRLNLTSAILHSPSLLLLDEPSAGQDCENVHFLLQAVRRIAGRGACLMVTHDPRVVSQVCTRVLFIAHKRVILDAPIPQAFAQLAAQGYDAYVPGSRQALSTGDSIPLQPFHVLRGERVRDAT